MHKKYLIYCLGLVAISLIVTACRSTKFVPEDKYLLNKVKIRVEQDKAQQKEYNLSADEQIQADNLKNYLRQKPNSEIFGFWKLQLGVWNSQGKDSTKWINRQIRKIGEAPEIFSEDLTQQSLNQIKKAMNNCGYFLSSVDTTMTIKKRKVSLTYHAHPERPYRIRQYTVSLDQSDLKRFATNKNATLKEGMLFDSNQMETERQRITRLMHIRGYYYFEKDFLQYIADSTYNTYEADLKLTLQDYLIEASDTIRKAVFTQYKIEEIVFHTNSLIAEENADIPDTVRRGDYTFLYQGRKLIRERTLMKTVRFKPGDLYNELRLERTYSALNALGPIKYVDISFEQISEDGLRCTIVLNRAKIHSVTADIEGTFSAGDWGIGAGLGYTNRNLFRGAEELTLNGKMSYEWRQNGGRAIEGKAEAGLRFPNNIKLSVGYNYQNRPDEFTRTIANAGVSYYFTSNRNRWRHSFNFLDINYVYLPWISDRFSEEFLQPTNILKYSYEDHFIMGWGYTGTYSSYNRQQPLRSYWSVQYGIETAGNLLYGINTLFHTGKTSADADDDSDYYKIFKIRYAQYVKGDVNVTFNHIFGKHHRLVSHAFLGVAVPFGNASSIPFEKRYFAGGANSVRGWTMRSLGPGIYRGNGARIDYNNQAGDIKLDLNLEYRVNLVWVLELALFTDAGNIWTIRDYESQPGGVFRFDEFYKQLAWSYGIGLRLNFDFFVFRVDFGVKLYDPSRINYDGKQWRTAANGLGWSDDMSFHFAIGYPF